MSAGPGLESAAAPRRELVLLVLLGALVFVPGLGSRDLWNPDEPRYAEVTREMRQTGDYLVPHLNGEVYAHKPPLFFWVVSLFAAVRGGVDETAARLPSAWAAVGALVVVFLLGDRLFGRRAAWYSALAFGSSLAVLHQARVGQIDMLLTFLVALAMLFWVRGHFDGRAGYYWLFFATLGLATLAKGPAGLLPPLLAVVAFLLVTGQRGELRRMRIGLGLALSAGVALAWFVPAAMAAGRDYLWQMTVYQNLERYFSTVELDITRGHHHPFYYYLVVVPVMLLPWSIFLPATVAVARRLESTERRGFLFALWWVAATLVFFSLSASKRHVYVLTMMPGAALMIGLALERASEPAARLGRWLSAPLTALVVAACLLPFGPLLARRLLADRLPEGIGAIPAMEAILVAFLLGVVLARWALARGRPAAAFACLGAAGTALALGIHLLVLPHFDPIKSPRRTIEAMHALKPPGDEYATLGHCPICIYYAGDHAVELEDFDRCREYVKGRERFWILARAGDLEQLEDLPLRVLAGAPSRPRSYLLVGPAESPPGTDAGVGPAD